jgi:DNA-binding CsgD family transcriptional regulator
MAHPLATHPVSEREALDAYESLTFRQRQVLRLVGEGYTSAQIAEQLEISPRTVDMHRRHALRRLGLRGQTALLRYAMQRRLMIDRE